MKKLFLSILFVSLIPSFSYAEMQTCANLDYSATARLSESVLGGKFTIRRLFKIEINDEVIYRNIFGKLDSGSDFSKDGYLIKMFSGGIIVSDGDSEYRMACGAPEVMDPDSPEHAEFIEYYKYFYSDVN